MNSRNKIKLIVSAFVLLFLCGMYVNSTTFFRLRLLESDVKNQAYDQAIAAGEKAIRKENLECWFQNAATRDHNRNILYKLLIKAYAEKKQWYDVARNLKSQKERDFLKIDSGIDNYLLGSYLLAFKENEEACKYFRWAITLSPDLYDAKRKLDICMLKNPPRSRLLDLNVPHKTIEVLTPNATFETVSKKDKTKPEYWSYYSSCGTKENNPWGISNEKNTGNYVCYLEQVFGKDEWLFSGYDTYDRKPDDNYMLYPDTAYQVTLWIKADSPMAVNVYSVEYNIISGYVFKKLLAAQASTEYQRFSSPVIFSGADTFKYRLGFELYHQKGKVVIDDVSLKEFIF